MQKMDALRDVQTAIKTKYTSFLALGKGDQWEIGHDVKKYAFSIDGLL